MDDSLSLPQTAVALLDAQPDVVVRCPMCHTQAPLTQGALDAGGAWRCVRCGQQWDARRLSAVAAYAAWVVEHDHAVTPRTERRQEAVQRAGGNLVQPRSSSR